MNSNFRVRNLVLIAVAIYLTISVAGVWLDYPYLKRVNLVADIFRSNQLLPVLPIPVDSIAPPVIVKLASKDFELYRRPHLITNFNSDSSQPALLAFVRKLHELKAGARKKIRIGYFGDSMIEGDLLSQTLRKLLQTEFGGSGVGFVPVSSASAGARASIIHTFSDGWIDESFKENEKRDNLYLSGHAFRGAADWVRIKDQTIKDSSASTEKSFLCGYADHSVSIQVNSVPVTIHPAQTFNRIPVGNDHSPVVKVMVEDESLPVYGLSFESESGIIVDNFSFRGITGVEYNKIDSNFLKVIAANNSYDLIIFQYGVNLMFRPNDLNFNWYAKLALPAIKKMKSCFSGVDFLLVSTADRAFNYDGEYHSAIGIDSLIKVQAALAYQANCAFYNHYESMGGHDAIVRWAIAEPSLANKDYVHPNARGADILGHYFFEAIMKDYQKYTR